MLKKALWLIFALVIREELLIFMEPQTGIKPVTSPFSCISVFLNAYQRDRLYI